MPLSSESAEINGTSAVEVVNAIIPGRTYAPSANALYMFNTSSLTIKSGGTYWGRSNLYAGRTANETVTVTCEAGGWLNVGGKALIVANDTNSSGILNIYGRNDSNPFWLARGSGSTAVCNYNTSETSSHRAAYVGETGDGTFNMLGGVFTVESLGGSTGDLGVAVNSGSKGHINLAAGQINCVSLTFGAGTGSIDVQDGMVVIDGDVTTTIQGYIDAGDIYAYDGDGTVGYDHNVTNTDKTSVYALNDFDPQPANNTSTPAATAEITWAVPARANPSFPVLCDVRFGTDPVITNNPLIITGEEVTSAPVSLASATPYYWQVTVYDSEPAAVFQSPVFTFSSMVAPPDPHLDDALTAMLWHMDTKYDSGGIDYVPDDDSANSGRDNELQLNYTFGNCDITTGSGGILGEALSFDGDDIALAPLAWEDTYAGVKVDFYLNLNSFGSPSVATYLFNSAPWSLSMVGSYIYWSVYDDAPSFVGGFFLDISGEPLGSWIHIVAEYDPLDDSVMFQVNDNIQTGTATGKMAQTNSNVEVGARLSLGASSGMDGLLDEVKISWYPRPVVCGDWGYLDADVNKDCVVNELDMKEVASYWLTGK